MRNFILCACVLVAILAPVALVAQTTTLVSVNAMGAAGNGENKAPAISADGRYVAFSSSSDNLVPGVTPSGQDVYVHDRATNGTIIASTTAGGQSISGNVWDGKVAISADGRFVAFPKGDQIFVKDLQTGTLEGMGICPSPCSFPSISGDGRYVTFHHNGGIVLHDRLLGTNTSVAGSSARAPSISADGRWIAFYSGSDIWAYDRVTTVLTRVNIDPSGVVFGAIGLAPGISGDGRYVLFVANYRAYVRDLLVGQTALVSVNLYGQPASVSNGLHPAISQDGNFIAFCSGENNLVQGDNNGVTDVFVWRRDTGIISRASVNAACVEGNAQSASDFLTLSGLGDEVAFESQATNFAAAPVPGSRQIFVRSQPTQFCTPPTPPCSAGTVNSVLGTPTDILLVNGSTGNAQRIVDIPLNAPIFVTLNHSTHVRRMSTNGIFCSAVGTGSGGNFDTIFLTKVTLVSRGCRVHTSTLICFQSA